MPETTLPLLRMLRRLKAPLSTARNHATAVSARHRASRASSQLRVVSTFEHGSPAPSIAPRCSASNVPDGDMTVRGRMLHAVLAMVFRGVVGDCLVSVDAVEAYGITTKETALSRFAKLSVMSVRRLRHGFEDLCSTPRYCR